MALNTFAATTLLTTALAAAALGSAGGATAAQSSQSSATTTVHSLEAQGAEVIMTTVGGGAPAQCSVVSVRPGPTNNNGKSLKIHGRMAPSQTHKTVYVHVRC
ncbi:hypothetical protein [Mycolicibacterium hodleri]|uniref:Uncharacterized protein n=1 Tax=Mycolicibacterium hodleri TaxID=49897 RepID=A0A502DLG8_9MYCO|nr:hypothetical protein [Mycolicibacterium hodleri]TPG26148.1 hypothetical protein EAH80_29685 [Mycolicibacterium hodleri]